MAMGDMGVPVPSRRVSLGNSKFHQPIFFWGENSCCLVLGFSLMATYSHFDQGLSGFIVLESSTFQAFLMKTKERLDTRAAEAEAEVPMIPNFSVSSADSFKSLSRIISIR